MAFFCLRCLMMALELARHDSAYEDMASKFFEHYVAILDAINTIDGTGLWDEQDGFYYDHLHLDGRMLPLRSVRWWADPALRRRGPVPGDA